MYGQAFRAPSFLELYALTAATRPNPDLTPERSQTWDLSFSYLASKDLKLGLGLYQFARTDLIAGDSSNQYQNMGNNTSNGIELEAMWQATKTLRVSGNLNYRDDSTFNSVPNQNAYLRTDWTFMPNWNWNVQASWTGKHSLPPGDPRSPMDAYSLVDTTIRYSSRRDWEFAASIRNLLDVDAREYTSSSLRNNLPLPLRSFYAELRYRF
jgi:iron complex outermembrane receptor protein